MRLLEEESDRYSGANVSMGSESYIVFNYARSDEARAGGQRWVSEFAEALRFRLGQLLGEGELPEGEILVSILSPGYVGDASCASELQEFLAGHGDASAHGRVFKVVKSPVSADQLPTELHGLASYELFATDPETGETRELSRHSPGDLSRRYWARLTDLAIDISRAIRPKESHADDSRTVFLAETSGDLGEERQLIRRELTQRGLHVLPDRPLPSTVAELLSQVREQLARCRLSIHPVGRSYGEVPEGGEESLVALQAELAIERGAAGGFSRLVWTPPNLQAEDERQRRLLERLSTDSRIGAGSDFLVTSLEKLKVTILCALDERRMGEEEATDAPHQVFLVCDQRDVERCRPLQEHLEDRGFGVALPSFEGDESDVRIDHERKLCRCDAVLIHWGEGSESWIRGMLLEVRKSLGLGRRKPSPETAVYLDAPETPAKASFVAGEGQATARTVEEIAPFLERIDRQGGEP